MIRRLDSERCGGTALAYILSCMCRSPHPISSSYRSSPSLLRVARTVGNKLRLRNASHRAPREFLYALASSLIWRSKRERRHGGRDQRGRDGESRTRLSPRDDEEAPPPMLRINRKKKGSAETEAKKGAPLSISLSLSLSDLSPRETKTREVNVARDGAPRDG